MRAAVEPAVAGKERLSRGALVVAALVVAACGVTSPDVPPPDGTTEPRERFADAVMSFGSTESPQSCGESLPPCEGTPVTCGPAEVLGAPDGELLILSPGEAIIIGFRCGSMREVGGVNSPDIIAWATVPVGARAVVSVSLAGNQYSVLDELNCLDEGQDCSSREIDLARIDLEVAQYLQIVHSGGDAIAIDAIEALRP